MIVAEISIVPIGTGSTSISEFIAESEKALQNHSGLTYQITGTGTEIESNNINEILDVIKEMHQAQINKGAQRVQTSIQIDDRRDKDSGLRQKVESVEAKI